MGNKDNKSAVTVEKKTSFFSECREELRKVVKPTKDETIQATIVTIVILAFVAIVLSLYDVILQKGLYFVYGVITGSTF